MGGVVVDAAGRTSVAGLWACGEVAYTGLHGANRLASNSLLEAVVCGRMVGEIIARSPSPRRELPPHESAGALPDPESDPAWPILRQRMWHALGPIRDGATLRDALAATAADRAALPAAALFLRRRFDLALAMLEAAADRNESRGAHWRRDFPRRDTSRDGPYAVHRQPAEKQLGNV
jgi:L-aspartate oxidase